MTRPPLALVSHNDAAEGAPSVLFKLAAALRAADPARPVRLLTMARAPNAIPGFELAPAAPADLAAALAPGTVVLLNTVLAIRHARAFASRGLRVLGIVHETRCPGAFDWVARDCFEGVARLVFVSRACRDSYLPGLLPPRVPTAVVPNWLAPAELAVMHSIAPPDDPEGEMRVVAVGSIAPHKGQLVAARAVARVPGASLLLVGTVYSREYAHAVRRELGDRVAFAGPVDKATALAHTRRAHVLLHASPMESFPLAVLEAMHAGTPIVAARVGGVPEQVEDGRHALLFEPGDAAAAAAALRRLQTEPGLARRLAAAAAQRAEAEFGEARALALYAAEIAQAAEPPPPR